MLCYSMLILMVCNHHRRSFDQITTTLHLHESRVLVHQIAMHLIMKHLCVLNSDDEGLWHWLK